MAAVARHIVVLNWVRAAALRQQNGKIGAEDGAGHRDPEGHRDRDVPQPGPWPC